MRRFIVISTSFLLLFSLYSCSASNNLSNDITNQNLGSAQGIGDNLKINWNTSLASKTYKDGTYYGKSDMTYDGIQTAVVVISGGRITDINLGTLDTNGNPVAYNNPPNGITEYPAAYGFTGNRKDKIKGNVGNVINSQSLSLEQVRYNLTVLMLKYQTHHVAVSNSTNQYTTMVDNWQLAVRRALEAATK